MQVEATVNACSAAPLTAMMNCVPKKVYGCVCVCVCVCVLLWIEIAASAGREHSRMGVLLRDQGGGEGKWEREESGFSGLSGRRVWESRVIRMWVMRK